MTTRTATTAALHCPYCRDRIGAREARVRCANCHTSFHAGCWAETRRCSVFGCSGQPEPRYPKALLFLPALVLVLASLGPIAAVVLSFLVFPAYVACVIEIVFAITTLVAGLRRIPRFELREALLPAFMLLSVNMVSIALFLRIGG